MPATRISYPLSLTQQLCYRTISWAGYYPKIHHVEWTGILSGPLREDLMLESITTVLSQHGILQSRMVNSVPGNVRIIPPSVARGRNAAQQVYLSRAGEGAADFSVRSVKAFVDTPFRLEFDDPLRALLLETSHMAWVLCLVGHHLIIDHKGMVIVIDSILREYGRRLHGREDRSSEQAVPSYFDFIEHEEASLENGHLLKRAHAAKRPSATPLLAIEPGDRDKIRLNATARQVVMIDGQHYERLCRTGQDYGVTQFTLLLQAVFIALRGVYRQSELTVQIIQDIRRKPFLQTVGHFGDMLLIEQLEIPEVLDVKKLRLLQDDLFRAIADRVPLMIFAEQVTWIRERMNQGLNPCEVMINYVSETAPPDEPQAGPQLELKPYVVDRQDNAVDPFDGILLYLEMVRRPSSIEVTMFSQSEALHDDIAKSILQRLLLVLSTP